MTIYQQVVDKNGEKHWKRAEVKITDHVNVPVFPAGLSPESYDKHLDDYVSKIVVEELPKTLSLTGNPYNQLSYQQRSQCCNIQSPPFTW